MTYKTRDDAWRNYYRSRITPPAGVWRRQRRRSLRPRGANLPEYSLPRELISVVIIVNPRARPSLGAIVVSEFSGVAAALNGMKVSGANVCAIVVARSGDDGDDLPAFSPSPERITANSEVTYLSGKVTRYLLSFVFANNQAT